MRNCRRLVARGHRRVEFAAPAGPGPQRHLAYIPTLGGLNPVERPSIRWYPPTRTGGAGAPGDASTAFICTAGAAGGFFEEMSAAGLHCPRDYSLVVLASEDAGTIELGRDGCVITKLEMPTNDVARQAALRLFELLNHGHVLPASRVPTIPCRITDGGTCGAAPRQS